MVLPAVMPMLIGMLPLQHPTLLLVLKPPRHSPMCRSSQCPVSRLRYVSGSFLRCVPFIFVLGGEPADDIELTKIAGEACVVQPTIPLSAAKSRIRGQLRYGAEHLDCASAAMCCAGAACPLKGLWLHGLAIILRVPTLSRRIVTS